MVIIKILAKPIFFVMNCNNLDKFRFSADFVNLNFCKMYLWLLAVFQLRIEIKWFCELLRRFYTSSPVRSGKFVP